MTLVVAVLVASLLGSVHCAAMCGGFVCFYSGGTAAPRRGGRSPLGRHAAYSVGRLAAYSLLGAMAGLVGGRVDRLASFAGVDRAAAILAGALMICWGAYRLAAQCGARVPRVGAAGVLQRRLVAAMARVGRWSPAWRAGAVGLLSALLPCGWLYTFVVTAGGTGSAMWGAGVMAIFWAGTLPMMLALGVGLQRATGPLQRRLPAFSAALVVLIGLLSIGGHLRVGPVAPAGHAAHAGHFPIHVGP